MLRLRLFSDVTDLDYEVAITPAQGFQVLNILQPPNYPSYEEFIRRYCDPDPDINPEN